MEDNFDVDKFISLVKTKESIWNYKSKTYSNRSQRREDWMAVCEAMIPDFNDKTGAEKCATALEYQAKWKVLRDGFTRSLKNYLRRGEPEGKRKLYTYYNQLQFLNDLYEDRNAASTKESAYEKLGDENSRKRQRLTAHKTTPVEVIIEHETEIEMPHSSNTAWNDTMEEDKQFLLSLLSDFRKIPEDQKLDCKGDIINVIRHYRNASSAMEPRGSFYTTDMAALATTAIEMTHSRDSSYYEHDVHNVEESSRGTDSPPEVKFFDQ